MSVAPAVAVTCDASSCDRVIVCAGEQASTYERARGYARAHGWVSVVDDDWCPEHGHAYGGHGFPVPYEHLQESGVDEV